MAARKSISRQAAPVDGRKLAIAMLKEFRDGTNEDASCCEAEFRHGQPQRDVLGPYLRTLREASPEVEAGFKIVMNDFLAACPSGYVDPELYEKLGEAATAD